MSQHRSSPLSSSYHHRGGPEMTNLYEHGLWSLSSPLPSLYSNPWRGQVFPLILLTSLSLHSQSPRTPQQQPSAPTTTRPLRWRIIMCCYLPFSPPPPSPITCISILLLPSSLCPTPGRDTSTSFAIVFSHAHDDIHGIAHKWGFLPPKGLWQRCCVGSVLPVWTERAFHSFTSLAAIVWEINFPIVASQLHRTCVAFDTSCLRWAGYIAATFFFFVFFLSYCTPESVTVIVRVVSLRLADEKSQLQILRCWVL